MSNFAALISPICISGSLNNSGTANVNGKAWAYLPGTTTPATVYADPAATVPVTQPITLDTGGRVPYSTYPNGVYTTQPIRLLIQDANGNGVSDTTFESAAGATAINNASPSLTTAPFTGATSADALAAIQTSLGGQDANYQAYTGTTARPIRAVLRSLQLTPEDFGAVGDGAADDTTPVQAMITKLASVSGGRGFFAKSYKVSSIAFPTNAAGIALFGAGQGVSSIIAASTADVFTASTATDISFSDMQITGNVGLTGVTRLGVRRVTINRGTSTSAYGLGLTGCSIVVVEDAVITGGSQVISLSGASASIGINRCRLGAGLGVTTACVDIAGATSSVFVNDTFFNAGSGSVTGIKWESGASGTQFNITDCPSIGGLATPFNTSALSADPIIIQRGNLYDNVTFTVATGSPTNVTPNSVATSNTIRVGSGGAGTIFLQAFPLTPSSSLDGKVVELHLYNNASGAVTWTFAAIYQLSAGVSSTDGAHITIGFYWDNATASWRERFRATT